MITWNRGYTYTRCITERCITHYTTAHYIKMHFTLQFTTFWCITKWCISNRYFSYKIVNVSCITYEMHCNCTVGIMRNRGVTQNYMTQNYMTQNHMTQNYMTQNYIYEYVARDLLFIYWATVVSTSAMPRIDFLARYPCLLAKSHTVPGINSSRGLDGWLKPPAWNHPGQVEGYSRTVDTSSCTVNTRVEWFLKKNSRTRQVVDQNSKISLFTALLLTVLTWRRASEIVDCYAKMDKINFKK